jgi:hypothetical protein
MELGVVTGGVGRWLFHEEDGREGDRGGIQRPDSHTKLGSVRAICEDALVDRAWCQDGAGGAQARGIRWYAVDVDDRPVVADAGLGVGVGEASPRLDGAFKRRSRENAGDGEGAVPVVVVGEVNKKILGSIVVDVEGARRDAEPGRDELSELGPRDRRPRADDHDGHRVRKSALRLRDSRGAADVAERALRPMLHEFLEAGR